MLYERNGSLVVLPKWDEKMIRRTRHFCGRAHASRYVERWIASPAAAVATIGVGELEPEKGTQAPVAAPVFSYLEDEAMAAELVARYS